MHCYRAFNLTVQSDVPLRALPPGEGAPDVTIRRQHLELASLAEWHNGRDRVCGFIDRGRFRFSVETGAEIVFDYDDDFASKHMIPTFLLGTIFSALLRQRDYLVLHASCVAKDGLAIGFLGDSGWGKSTLAEYFCQQGYTLLSDDILAIEFGSGEPVAIPGFPQVKLAPGAGRHLRTDYDLLSDLHSEAGKKVHHATEHFESATCALAGIFVLEHTAANQTELVDIPGQQRLCELIRHTRMNHRFTHPAYQRRHLDQCSALIQGVPIRVLRRVRSLDRLADIFELVDASVSQRMQGVGS